MDGGIVKRKRRTKEEIAAAAATSATVNAKVVKKKSTQPTVAVVTTAGIQGSFEITKKHTPLIAHLDIRSADVVFYDQPIQYNPNPSDLLSEPQPYDAQTEDMFACVSEEVSATAIAAEKQVQQDEKAVVSTVQKHQRKEYAPQELLVCYAASSLTQQLPESVNVHCFWCCHAFDGKPCVIPQSSEGGVWKVYGNFCCPSCALSYLLNQVMDTHLRWERIGLLNRLYNPTVGGRIYPAPARETLSIFGGILGIDEFREIIDKRQIRIDIQWPPMVSILASMDTKPIDFYETSIKNSFVDGSAFAKGGNDGLKLKRTKPLKDRESTLDSYLNLSVQVKN